MATFMHDDFSEVTEDDLRGDSQYPNEGQYFVLITNVDNSRKDVDALKIDLVVYAGTVAGQESKKFTETIWDPSAAHKDGGKFARSKKARLILAAGIAKSFDELKSPEFRWSPEDLTYRVFKAAVVHRKSRNEKKNREYTNAQIDGLSLWAPNDPEAAHIPSNQEVLDLARQNGQLNAVLPDSAPPSNPVTAEKKSPVRSVPRASAAADPYAAL